MEFEKCLDKNGNYKTTKKNHKLLFKKVSEGDIEFLTKVLEGNPEIVDVVGEGSSWYLDKTPLMYAFQCGKSDVCNLLIDCGADVNFVMPGGPKTPMCNWAATLAAMYGGAYPEFMKILKRILAMGADPNLCEESFQRDAMHEAISQCQASNNGHYETVQVLLEAGADPDYRHREWLLRLAADYTYIEGGEVKTRSTKLAPEIFSMYGISQEELKAANQQSSRPVEPPFLEHPNGDHKKAKSALIEAMQGLDRLGETERWINFSGQGRGKTDETYVIRDVAYRNGILDLTSDSADVSAIQDLPGIASGQVSLNQSGQLDITPLTPPERGLFMDDLFLKYFQLKPTLKGRDYAVGVEWL
jgi:hypothetical protein